MGNPGHPTRSASLRGVVLSGLLCLACASAALGQEGRRPDVEVYREISAGRYAAAVELAETWLTRLREEGTLGTLEEARILDQMSYARNRLGLATEERTAEGIERARRLKLRLLGPDHPELASSLHVQGEIHAAAGRPEEARRAYAEALRIRQAHDPAELGRTLRALANLESSLGRFEEALPLAQRALDRHLQGPNPRGAAAGYAYVTLGVLQAWLGDFTTARRHYLEALEIWEERLGDEHPNLVSVQVNLGILHGEWGDAETALSYMESAIGMHEKLLGPEHPGLGIVLVTHAAQLLRAGRLADAEAAARRALRIAETHLPAGHRHRVIAGANLGRILLDAGRPADALPYFEASQPALDRLLGRGHPDTARNLALLGRAHGLLGDPAAARDHLQQAVEVRRRILGLAHPDTASCLVELAVWRWVGGDDEGAFQAAREAEAVGRSYLQRTVAALSERQALEAVAVVDSALDLLLTLAAEPGAPRERVDAAWDTLIRSRGLVLGEMASRWRRAAAGEDPVLRGLATELRQARERVASLIHRGPGESPAEPFHRRLDAAISAQEKAERALAARRGDSPPSSEGLAEVRRALPPASRLVGFARYRHLRRRGPGDPRGPGISPHAYLAFVLSPRGAPQVVRLGEAAVLDPLVETWRQAVESAPRGVRAAKRRQEADYRRAAGELSRRVWDRLPPLEGETTRTFLVPDGALLQVSFAALPQGEDRYLVEEPTRLHYLSTERDLARPKRRKRGRGALLLGAPDFDLHGARPERGLTRAEVPSLQAAGTLMAGCRAFGDLLFPGLPGAELEVREIASLLSVRSGDSPTLLTGAGADEASFKARAPGTRLLHLATHGFSVAERCAEEAPTAGRSGALRPALERSLLFSGLALAGSNRPPARSSSGEDGVLTAAEVASLDLTGVEWAVLSACNSGRGAVRLREGLLGLRRAFEIAGAETLILSLWPVDDASTRHWMRRLYAGRRAGLDTDEAVHRATLESLEQRRAQGLGSHPFHWAAFIATGEWRRDPS